MLSYKLRLFSWKLQQFYLEHLKKSDTRNEKAEKEEKSGKELKRKKITKEKRTKNKTNLWVDKLHFECNLLTCLHPFVKPTMCAGYYHKRESTFYGENEILKALEKVKMDKTSGIDSFLYEELLEAAIDVCFIVGTDLQQVKNSAAVHQECNEVAMQEQTLWD